MSEFIPVRYPHHAPLPRSASLQVERANIAVLRYMNGMRSRKHLLPFFTAADAARRVGRWQRIKTATKCWVGRLRAYETGFEGFIHMLPQFRQDVRTGMVYGFPKKPLWLRWGDAGSDGHHGWYIAIGLPVYQMLLSLSSASYHPEPAWHQLMLVFRGHLLEPIAEDLRGWRFEYWQEPLR